MYLATVACIRDASDQTEARNKLHSLSENIREGKRIDDFARANLEMQFDEPAAQQPKGNLRLIL